MPTNHLNVARKTTRRIIDKTRDATYGKKVATLYAVKQSHEPAIVVCLERLRDYIDCLFDPREFEDVRLEQLKFDALAKLGDLISELEKGVQRNTTIAIGVVGDALRHHGNLFKFVSSSRIEMEDCSDEWGQTMSLAVQIWGNRL